MTAVILILCSVAGLGIFLGLRALLFALPADIRTSPKYRATLRHSQEFSR